jgi:antitoxin HigA-1
MTRKLAPMHPGEVLREEFLVPLKLSPGALARKMDVPRPRIERITAQRPASLPTPRYG